MGPGIDSLMSKQSFFSILQTTTVTGLDTDFKASTQPSSTRILPSHIHTHAIKPGPGLQDAGTHKRERVTIVWPIRMTDVISLGAS